MIIKIPPPDSGVGFLMPLVSIVFALMLSGCANDVNLFEDNYHRVTSKDQAGSSQVAVISIAPWDAYIKALSTNFTISDSSALTDVLPDTFIFTRKELDAKQLGLKLALPTSGTTSTETTTTAADGTETTTGTSTKTKAPGNLATVETTPSVAANRSAAAIPGKDLSNLNIGDDPFLQYQVALALKQEVTLLNNQVRDAAVRQGMTPYVVRMQVTLIPSARNQPYDADIYASFFNGDTKNKPYKTPYLIPLLAADNLEGALQSRSIDQLRKLSLALAANIQGVGAGVDAQSLNDQLESVFGRDLNSLMTLARASDNTLRIHLGAQLSPKSEYSMVTRNHYVNFLLLVDEQYASKPTGLMSMVARTELTDSLTGVRLPNRSLATAFAERDQIAASYKLSGLPDSIWNCLISHVQENDLVGFEALIKKTNPGTPTMALWSSLVSLLDGASFDSASFDLPQPITSTPALDSKQTLLIVDNGSNTSVNLTGANLSGRTFSTSIDVGGLSIAGSVLSASHGIINLQFPSLHTWNLFSGSNGRARNCAPTAIRINIKGGGLNWNSGKSSGCKYLYKKPGGGKITSPFTLGSAASGIISDKGVGTLKLSVNIKATQQDAGVVIIHIKGADIDSIKGGSLLSGNRIRMTASGDVVLKLSRLIPGETVKVESINANQTFSPTALILPISKV